MSEQNRDSLTDDQLSALLKKWIVVAPQELEHRVIASRAELTAAEPRRTWLSRLLKGYIRVPIPVACCLALLMIAVLWRSTRLPAACVGANLAPHAVSVVAAKAAPPAQAPASIGACDANSKC